MWPQSYSMRSQISHDSCYYTEFTIELMPTNYTRAQIIVQIFPQRLRQTYTEFYKHRVTAAAAAFFTKQLPTHPLTIAFVLLWFHRIMRADVTKTRRNSALLHALKIQFVQTITHIFARLNHVSKAENKITVIAIDTISRELAWKLGEQRKMSRHWWYFLRYGS